MTFMKTISGSRTGLATKMDARTRSNRRGNCCVAADMQLSIEVIPSMTRFRQYLRKYGGPDPTKSRP